MQSYIMVLIRCRQQEPTAPAQPAAGSGSTLLGPLQPPGVLSLHPLVLPLPGPR